MSIGVVEDVQGGPRNARRAKSYVSDRFYRAFSILPSIYILAYGIYLTFGPIDIYEDGTKNFFLKNPEEKELPIVFVLLKFYQYILILAGAVFSYLYLSYLKKLKNNKNVN